MGDVFAFGPGPRNGALPVPFAHRATEALQETVDLAIVVDDARHLGPAVVVDAQSETFTGHGRPEHVVRQSIRRSAGAKRVPVVVGRYDVIGDGTEFRRSMAQRVSVRRVDRELGECLESTVELVVQEGVNVDTVKCREQVAILVVVVTISALPVHSAAGSVSQVPLAARVAGWVGLEFASAVPKNIGQTQGRDAADHVVLSVLGIRAAVPEDRAVTPR